MFDDTGLLTGYFLPAGEDVAPTFGARVSLQVDLADGFAVVGELTVLANPNRVLLGSRRAAGQ